MQIIILKYRDTDRMCLPDRGMSVVLVNKGNSVKEEGAIDG